MLFGARDKQTSSHPDREPTTDQSNNTAKVQLHEPMNLLGLITRIWVTDTSRNRDISGSCVTESPRQPVWQLRRSWHLEVRHMTCRSESIFSAGTTLYTRWDARGLVNLLSFRDFLRLLSCLLFESWWASLVQDGMFYLKEIGSSFLILECGWLWVT